MAQRSEEPIKVRDQERPETSEPSVTRMQLRSAYLLRCISNGQKHCFILEKVETRKRRRFDSLQALLVHLQEILSTSGR
jgi:hypothetical protein